MKTSSVRKQHLFLTGARFAGSIVAGACTLLTAGCASYTSATDASFGDSLRMIRAQQVIDPSAPTRNRSLGVVDGKAVAGTHKTLVEGYGYTTKEGNAPPPTIIVAPTTEGRR